MPVSGVTTGETLTEAWGDSVADAISALEASVGASSLPAGAILPYGGSTAPTGFLLCDGSSVLRSTYSALFGVIGTTFGSVDGTHFTLPDLRGRFALGRASAGTGSTLGASGGALGHTHTGASHLHTGPSHQHASTSHLHTGPSHTHTGPSHAHELPIQGPGGGLARLPAATFGTGGSYAAGALATAAADSASRGVMLSNTEGNGASGSSGTGNTGSTTPTDAGASGTGNTGSTASGASSGADAPFLAVQYIIRT